MKLCEMPAADFTDVWRRLYLMGVFNRRDDGQI